MFRKDKDKDKSKKSDEDVHEELRRLREEMAELRDRLEDTKESRRRRKSRDIPAPEIAEGMEEFGRKMGDFGKEMGDYISLVVKDAMKGADRAMRSVFIGPKGADIRVNGKRISWDPDAEPAQPVPPEEAQRLLSPLASAERIKILYLLAEEPRYHQDLMDKSGLAPGTLPHHLKQLEEAGFVTQERVRGRYLITIPGRMALKLAEYLYNQMQSGVTPDSEPEEKEEK